jgi:hypothetical protein
MFRSCSICFYRVIERITRAGDGETENQNMKTTKNITTIAALAATFILSSAMAELRIWTDATGKTIEAEQVQVLNNQVVLRLVDQREIKVSLDSLCTEDRARAMLNQPPTLDIKVSAKTSRSNSSLRDTGRASRRQVQEESIGVDVRIQKRGSAQYEAELTAKLYVIGERNNSYEILNETESKFEFSKESGTEHIFSSSPITVEKLEGRGPGVEYKGYLLVITDSQGEVVELKSSNGTLQHATETILAARGETQPDTDVEPQEAAKKVRSLHRFNF